MRIPLIPPKESRMVATAFPMDVTSWVVALVIDEATAVSISATPSNVSWKP